MSSMGYGTQRNCVNDPEYTMAKRANIPVVQTGGSGARTAAELLLGVFDAHQAQFRLVTRRAEARFLRRDWAGDSATPPSA